MQTRSSVSVITSGNEHWYPSPTIPGTFYPSVTTIIGAGYPKGVGLQKYLAEQESWESSQELLKAAGERGTNVHRATELLEDGKTLVRGAYSDTEWRMIMGFVEWHREVRPETLFREVPLSCDTMRVGGTIDRVYRIGGETVIVDFKTSKNVYRNHHIQTGTYRALLANVTGVLADKTAVLRLRTTGRKLYQWSERTADEAAEDYELFKNVKAIWDDMNPKARPSVLELPETLALDEEQAPYSDHEMAGSTPSRGPRTEEEQDTHRPERRVRRGQQDTDKPPRKARGQGRRRKANP